MDAITILEQLREDLAAIEITCPLVKATLIHRADSVVEQFPTPFPPFEWFAGAGSFDWLGKGESKHRIVTLSSTDQMNAQVSKLISFAETAGAWAMTSDFLICKELSKAWESSGPDHFWWMLLFELGWQKRHPLLNPSPPAIWWGPFRSKPYDQLVKEAGPGKTIPEAYLSEIPNLSSASKYAIEFLIDYVKRDDGRRAEIFNIISGEAGKAHIEFDLGHLPTKQTVKCFHHRWKQLKAAKFPSSTFPAFVCTSSAAQFNQLMVKWAGYFNVPIRYTGDEIDLDDVFFLTLIGKAPSTAGAGANGSEAATPAPATPTPLVDAALARLQAMLPEIRAQNEREQRALDAFNAKVKPLEDERAAIAHLANDSDYTKRRNPTEKEWARYDQLTAEIELVYSQNTEHPKAKRVREFSSLVDNNGIGLTILESTERVNRGDGHAIQYWYARADEIRAHDLPTMPPVPQYVANITPAQAVNQLRDWWAKRDTIAPITSPTPPPATPVPPQPAAEDAFPDVAMLSHVDISSRLKIPSEALRRRLDRWRTQNGKGWQDVPNPEKNQPKYLYQWGAVKTLVAKAAKTSALRPASE